MKCDKLESKVKVSWTHYNLGNISCVKIKHIPWWHQIYLAKYAKDQRREIQKTIYQPHSQHVHNFPTKITKYKINTWIDQIGSHKCVYCSVVRVRRGKCENYPVITSHNSARVPHTALDSRAYTTQGHNANTWERNINISTYSSAMIIQF